MARRLLAVLGAIGIVGGAAANASAKDYSIIARDIVPWGNFGSLPTSSTLPAIERQAQMHNALTPCSPG
jgi:hypothetical protein